MKHQIKIDLPEEFIELCKADEVEPEMVLRGFIADLAGIINWQANPREDGYGSNGSDERRMACEYYDRVGYPYWREWGDRIISMPGRYAPWLLLRLRRRRLKKKWLWAGKRVKQKSASRHFFS